MSCFIYRSLSSSSYLFATNHRSLGLNRKRLRVGFSNALSLPVSQSFFVYHLRFRFAFVRLLSVVNSIIEQSDIGMEYRDDFRVNSRCCMQEEVNSSLGWIIEHRAMSIFSRFFFPFLFRHIVFFFLFSFLDLRTRTRSGSQDRIFNSVTNFKQQLVYSLVA